MNFFAAVFCVHFTAHKFTTFAFTGIYTFHLTKSPGRIEIIWILRSGFGFWNSSRLIYLSITYPVFLNSVVVADLWSMQVSLTSRGPDYLYRFTKVSAVAPVPAFFFLLIRAFRPQPYSGNIVLEV